MSTLDRTAEVAPGISLGYSGQSCGKALSEDFFDLACPDPADRDASGLVLALADGMSGGAGRRAAETCVRAVLSDFYAAPTSWEVAHRLEKIIAAVNAWLLAHNVRAAESECMLSTLSVLVLHGREFHIAHVGDSRIYRLRNNLYECMTTDHVWPRRDMRHVLRRAVGLDHHLVVDSFSGELQAGDRFVIDRRRLGVLARACRVAGTGTAAMNWHSGWQLCGQTANLLRSKRCDHGRGGGRRFAGSRQAVVPPGVRRRQSITRRRRSGRLSATNPTNCQGKPYSVGRNPSIDR
jgi:hypothetical protein